jgi:hypothetical protein
LEIPVVEVPLTLKWRFHERNDGEIATFRGFALKLMVQDCDGDGSWWELREGDNVLAKGEHWGHKPIYHFVQCLLDAEAALYAEIKRREDLAFGPKAANDND